MAFVPAVLAAILGSTNVAVVANGPEGPWRSVGEGEVLPKSCVVKTAEFGVSRVLTTAGELQLAPGSSICWNGSLAVDKGVARWVRSGEVVAANGAEAKFDWEASSDSTRDAASLTVHDPQSNSPTRLNVARCHIDVDVRPPVALVRMEYGFYNPYDREREGEFTFRLPAGTSISRFAVYTSPTTLVEGEVVEREKASGIYESIVRSRRDPALLEQESENLFRMKVFPLPPREVKRIFLDYVIPVVPESGRCRLRLPLFADLEPIGEYRLRGSIARGVAAKVCVARQRL